MRTEIGANKNRLWLALVVLASFVGVTAFFISMAIQHPVEGHSIWVMNGFLTAMTLLLFVGILINFMRVPTGIIFDKHAKIIEIHFLLKSTVILDAKDLIYYSSTVIITKHNRYPGLLLYTANGCYLLSDFNLKTHRPVIAFLNSMHVKRLSHEPF